jgi:hypothetical protein
MKSIHPFSVLHYYVIEYDYLIAINLFKDGCARAHPQPTLYEKYSLGISLEIIKKIK